MSLRIKGFLIFIAAITLFQAGLGFWQWQRMGEKEAFLAGIAAAAKAPPRLLGEARLWDRVTVTGRFVHERASYVRTSRPEPKPGNQAGRTLQGSGFGVFVMTPFITRLCGADGKCALVNVYVNRGFLPTRADGRLPPFDRPTEPVTLTGFLRPTETAGFFPPHNDPQRQVWFFRSTAEMARQTGLPGAETIEQARVQYNRFIDLQAAPDAVDPPHGVEVEAFLAAIPNNHFQYALTWWGLALTNVVVLTFFLASRRRRGTSAL
ncbi:MAG: SURF1 family protein [Beijerinckiaceae bacterium]|nr:SURF1 family protein [Beijerinckiaceae bacterium]MCZ8298900.1 SURF1 family protein [Beijerinckiaceae bacterium]